MIEIFSYHFFRNALFAALLTSISCGIIGTYIVSKRMVFLAGGITHASFGGIGIGYALGVNPFLTASIFSVASAALIEIAAKKTDLRKDSAIGILWSFGMVVGIIAIILTPGYAPDLMSFLFGSILTVTDFELVLMLFSCLAVILFFVLLFKEIVYVSFNEEFAKSLKLPADLINLALISLVSLTIVISARVAGIILVLSLLTIPPGTANLFSNNFKDIIFYSIIFSFLSSFTGLILSYFINIPSGASIILSSIVFFIFAWLVKKAVIKIKLLIK